MEEKLTYQAGMFKETFEHEFTYLNGFRRNVRRFKERTVLTCPTRARSGTYPQVNAECNRLAHALMGDGVGKRDVVMYQLFNCAELAFPYLAAKKNQGHQLSDQFPPFRWRDRLYHR